MLSRVADAVHWMSRYIERAESIARFVDVIEQVTLDLPQDGSAQWRSLVTASGDDNLFEERYGNCLRPTVLTFLTFDPKYPSSIWSCLRAARENARSVREIISSDMWEHINRAYLMVKNSSESADRIIADPEPFLKKVRAACHTIHGATEVSMTHNDAWMFMRMGRLLERADKTSRILDVKTHPLNADVAGDNELLWAALLQSVSGLEMYRQTHRRIRPKKVLSFILFDDHFPRSIRFCVSHAERSHKALGTASLPGALNPVQQCLGRLRARLEFASVDEVLEVGVHAWVDELQSSLNEVGSAMQSTYFDLGPVSSSGSTQNQTQDLG